MKNEIQGNANLHPASSMAKQRCAHAQDNGGAASTGQDKGQKEGVPAHDTGLPIRNRFGFLLQTPPFWARLEQLLLASLLEHSGQYPVGCSQTLEA